MKQGDYSKELSGLCISVMLDVLSCIGKYRKDFVLVGGLVPKILLNAQEHIGTYDVDFAVNSHNISEQEYATIAEMLFQRGYRYRKDRKGDDLQFSFEREVVVNGATRTVVVDLVGPEYGTKTPKGFRDRLQEGVHVHKARGIDLVFGHTVEIQVSAQLPDGIQHTEKVKVANGAAYLVLKLITFEARKAEKDAYDIYYCLKYYPGGLDALVAEFRLMQENGLAQEALEFLEKLFKDKLNIGPQRFARFSSDEPVERDVLAAELSSLASAFLARFSL